MIPSVIQAAALGGPAAERGVRPALLLRRIPYRGTALPSEPDPAVSIPSDGFAGSGALGFTMRGASSDDDAMSQGR
jgi:hypothetical protein